MEWSGSRRRIRSVGREHGATLIEVLVASVITGSAALVIVMAMGTLYTSATENRQQTTASIVARSYAEALDVAVAQASSPPPQPGWCHGTYTVAYTPPSGFHVSPAFGACPGASAPQFQTVTLTVTP